MSSGSWVVATPTPGAANVGASDTNVTPPDDSSDTDNTGDTSTTTDTGATTTATGTTSSDEGGPATYLPIPTLRIMTSGDRTVSADADTAFTAAVYDNNGNKRGDAIVAWSFGDGMRSTGASVYHEYYDPGEYAAVVHATTDDGGDASSEAVVTVKDAGIAIASVSSRGITLANNDSRTLDLSLWRLSMGGQEFKIPEDTEILAGHAILFPSQVIELPAADSASLLYPSGEVAATYPPAGATQASAPQPPAPPTSYEKVQAVEPIISTTANVSSHDAEAVSAPAIPTQPVETAGAAVPLPEEGLSTAGASSSASASTLLKSPWTAGLLGVMAAAGGAFILL